MLMVLINGFFLISKLHLPFVLQAISSTNSVNTIQNQEQDEQRISPKQRFIQNVWYSWNSQQTMQKEH